MNNMSLLDPAPEEWLNARMFKTLKDTISPSLLILREAKVQQIVLESWVALQLGETESERLIWARSQWEYRIETLFLNNKDLLDKASCKLIRVNDQGLALEIFHRLLNKEDNFEMLSILYGQGPERFNGGFLDLRPMRKYSGGLDSVLSILKVGELSKPLRVGQQFAIVQLVEWLPSELSKEAEDLLLENELKLWIKGMADYLDGELNSKLT